MREGMLSVPSPLRSVETTQMRRKSWAQAPGSWQSSGAVSYRAAGEDIGGAGTGGQVAEFVGDGSRFVAVAAVGEAVAGAGALLDHGGGAAEVRFAGLAAGHMVGVGEERGDRQGQGQRRRHGGVRAAPGRVRAQHPHRPARRQQRPGREREQ
ncbi:hypothetical protein ADK38_34800 [Streptomyces varsoviensis]|uniref:Uncharacterized protein n=1 Tax=Streptomyces varsoviensis TaxID=67373 RepID=A0ABR5IXA3_9ACTN|nr:hypothetical protein ADK38_34800 [Streptomyces varsoviensis]